MPALRAGDSEEPARSEIGPVRKRSPSATPNRMRSRSDSGRLSGSRLSIALTPGIVPDEPGWRSRALGVSAVCPAGEPDERQRPERDHEPGRRSPAVTPDADPARLHEPIRGKDQSDVVQEAVTRNR